MKVTGLNTSRLYSLKVADYLIDWKREVSRPQALVKQFLYPFWKNGIVLEEVRIPASRLRIDLLHLGKKVAIEVSPSSSHSFNPFFHQNKIKFGQAVKRELDKQRWCETNGFLYIELTDEDLDNLSKKMFAERGLDL